jgi:hypothetical protein
VWQLEAAEPISKLLNNQNLAQLNRPGLTVPRLLELKKRVDACGMLGESDIQFMGQVTLDAQRSKWLTERHPEWHEFCAGVIHLYEDVAEKALDNESRL